MNTETKTTRTQGQAKDAAVDVLAVMDRATTDGVNENFNMIAARAAVAELIAEAAAVLAHVEDEGAERVGQQCTLCYSYRSRLRAALARVGGGK